METTVCHYDILVNKKGCLALDIMMINKKISDQAKDLIELCEQKKFLQNELEQVNKAIKNVTEIGRDQTYFEDLMVDFARKGEE